MEVQTVREYQRESGSDETRRILFGKYEMGRLLGQGTFAKVYKGKNMATQEQVAIKVIHKDLVKKQGLMDQIKREISVMHLVKHPNIVELKEVLATKSKVFFVMEYVRGGELFAKVEKGKLKEDVGRKYFQQLISAVDYCHSRGVSHRDLKPENLLLDDKEDLKVSDFGFSALPEHHWNDGLLHTQCGTPAYVAPEVLRKKGYDGAKADIWSCGVILFVLLAGYLPFKNSNLMKMYVKILKAEYEFPPWFSKGAKELISKLLVVDPRKRITIPEIKKTSWFQHRVLKPTVVRSDLEDNDESRPKNKEERLVLGSKHSPPFLNAFELISSMSSVFDLSSLFEKRKKCSTFTSKCPVPKLVGRLESAAKELDFGVAKGRKGKLEMTAKVFEVAPEVSMVEFSKSSGDTLEYTKFYEDHLRPSLKDIVWAWQE
ncbi:hypothetical protein K2173_019085 [Erythroxylum novogranatense]|uniref:non-specific serine/threonine protein kinase n=1 Tax=Erythroxylum novogranatense TaxID=1862640 RepID=A0AAV8SSK6_9ROSI|nr:hypothetical protein K2173_019085 [Erythroxylum novogranatense]